MLRCIKNPLYLIMSVPRSEYENNMRDKLLK